MILLIVGFTLGFVTAALLASRRVKLAEDTLTQLRRQKQDHPNA